MNRFDYIINGIKARCKVDLILEDRIKKAMTELLNHYDKCIMKDLEALIKTKDINKYTNIPPTEDTIPFVRMILRGNRAALLEPLKEQSNDTKN